MSSPLVSPRNPVFGCCWSNLVKGALDLANHLFNRLPTLTLTSHVALLISRELRYQETSTVYSRQNTTMDSARSHSKVPEELPCIGPEVRFFTRLTKSRASRWLTGLAALLGTSPPAGWM